jgi:hypothetical protein
MKTSKKFMLLAAVVTVGTTLSSTAAEPLYSPKAKEQAASLETVPNLHNDVNLVTMRPDGNAKAWEAEKSLREVPIKGPGIDLTGAPRPNLPAKDPGYEAAWRANAVREYEVASVR